MYCLPSLNLKMTCTWLKRNEEHVKKAGKTMIFFTYFQLCAAFLNHFTMLPSKWETRVSLRTFFTLSKCDYSAL